LLRTRSKHPHTRTHNVAKDALQVGREREREKERERASERQRVLARDVARDALDFVA
jgi:hypothetical protein